MSVETSETKTAKPNRQKTRSAKRFLTWKRVGAFLLFLVFILGCLGLYIWVNRYNLIERYAKSTLQEQGIVAELSIETLTRKAVTLKNVSLTYEAEDKPFFSAKRVEADYILKEAMQGRMKRLRFVEPKARITLDEKFRIIDGWAPPKSTDNPQGLSLPENGFFLEDASFNLVTPYGNPDIAVTAVLRETDQFDATIIFDPTTLNYKDWALDGSARFDLAVKGDAKEIEALVSLESLTGSGLDVRDAVLNVDGVVTAKTNLPLDLDSLDIDYTGDISGIAAQIKTQPVLLKNGQFDWQGEITRIALSDVPVGMKGRLTLGTDQFSFSDPLRARELAELLSLSEALAKTPIAQHFGPSVTKVLEQLLQNSAIQSSANILVNEQGINVSLREPLNINRDTKTLKLTALAETPIYQWDRREGRLDLALNAAMSHPVPLKMTTTYIEATSKNGWQLDGVESFKANVESQTNWRAISDEETARLAPFKSTLDYNVRPRDRLLSVQGGVDFDGRLPFGYVTDLKTAGIADIKLAPTGQSGLTLSYRPKVPLMTIASLETTTDWALENVVLNLDEGQDVFRNKNDQGDVKASASDVSFLASNRVDGRNMTIQAAKAQILGKLDFLTGVKNWSVDFAHAEMRSDTVPVEGTLVTVPSGILKVRQDSQDLNFDFETEALDVQLPTGSVTGLTVSAKGTADRYVATHSGGVFKSTKGDVPQWPVSGSVSYENDIFTGEARAIIPKTTQTPILVNYTMKDGVTEAGLELESLKFVPGRLQPQTLLPALAGKIAAVEGEVSAAFELRYEAGEFTNSSGVLNVINMNFGTAPGPVSDLNTDIRFSSLFPVQTAGSQTLTLKSFDPGMPLVDGVIDYDLLPEGIKINSAVWPIGTVGSFALDPFVWRYGAEENRVVMRMNEIPIQEFLNSAGNTSLEVSGTLKGEFPIVVRGLNVLVDKGYLEASDGGVIRYGAKDGTAKTYSQEEALAIIRRQDSPQYSALARDALREFNYRALRASIDGPLDGDVQLGVIFDGTNKKVLNGQPFEFDIDVQGELFNILRSFNSNAQIKSELLRKGVEQAE